jgi:glycogen operon protein
VLARVPLIAEAWDAAGLYHVGAFPGMAWAEWNGRYRDLMRRFLRGDAGLVGEVATRIAGSADLYADGRRPTNSINFITSHDGFTLHDLYSYELKRNGDNGQDNRDGTDDNASWNCGAEGPSTDPAVRALRQRLARNAMAVLLLSRGVPMLLAGDEVLRSQGGNNNAWCQDNAVSWFDWSLLETQREMLRFTRELIAFRRRHPCLTADRFFDGRPVPGRGMPDIRWHGERLDEPPWNDPQARLLAFMICAIGPGEEDLHVVLNMSDLAVEAAIAPIEGRRWHLAIDTSRASPWDIVPPREQSPHAEVFCRTGPRSVVVLEAR